MTRRNICAALLAGVVITAAAPARAAAPEVQTVGGSGKAGIADGPAAQASFLSPEAVSVAKDGTLYIADRAAQRIRVLRHGTVTTVAGSGSLSADGLSVAGGYRDGLAAQAQFQFPSGVAVAPGGAVYIADSGNACIRKLERGIVSTVIGKPGDSRAVDGGAGVGRFVEPRALAFDAHGNLYIADFGGGLRRLTRAGVLQTVHLKAAADRSVLSVAVEPGDEGTVVVTTPQNVLIYYPRSGADDRISLDSSNDGGPFGTPGAVAAIDHREFLFSDSNMAQVRYLRLAPKPYSAAFYSRLLAGGGAEYSADNAGFRDGTRHEARFFQPAGIDVAGRTAYVADAGNRRIRRISLPPLVLSEAGLDWQPADDQHYEIYYMGASSSFFDSLTPADSICGNLETFLNNARRFNRPVRCHSVRTDAATVASHHDYIENFVAPRGVNLVILQLSVNEIANMDPTRNEKLGLAGKLTDVQMRPIFRKKIEDILRTLKPFHTKLAIVWSYLGITISADESFVAREWYPNLRDLPVDEYPYHKKLDVFKSALTGLPVLQYDAYDDFLKYERGAPVLPLFATSQDMHPTPIGNARLARSIGKFLLALPAALR